MLPPGITPKSFDCVSTSFVLQAACSTDEELNNAVCNLASLLNPGGTLITLTVFGATYFIGNKIKMQQLCLSDANLSLAFKKAGLSLVYKRNNDYQAHESNAKSYGIYIAKKKVLVFNS